MYSRRRLKGHVPQGLALDWALELGEAGVGDAPHIFSQHERGEDFSSTLTTLEGRPGLVKLAVEDSGFSELKRGHFWWLEDPEHRSFLPRSKDGRWQWYRSLFRP